ACASVLLDPVHFSARSVPSFKFQVSGFSFSESVSISVHPWLKIEAQPGTKNGSFRSSMPTVLRIGNLRFHFYSDELSEPAHIHVANPDGECKFWLVPVRLASNHGVKPHDLRRIEILVFANRSLLNQAYEKFDGR
ncbi:MAG: DUF4160 domain-containing protein, partial [Verrucomicrobiota bacterium]